MTLVQKTRAFYIDEIDGSTALVLLAYQFLNLTISQSQFMNATIFLFKLESVID